MDTVKVQWQAALGQWQVTDSHGQHFDLEQWAQTLPDLTSVRMVLSAANYSVHWLSLVGVSQRHLAKILPFALEESLIEDIGHYHILPAGSVNKRFRAYVVAKELITQLLEACQLHHLVLTELVPETALLGRQTLCVRAAQGWLFNWPGLFEGYVPDGALTSVLESVLADDVQIEQLQVQSDSLDQINLFKTQLDTGFPGQIKQIESQVLPDIAVLEIPAKASNLLSGQFQLRQIKKDQPKAWWRPVVAMAAVWLLLWTVSLYADLHRTQNQAKEVHSQSLALYKQLFPGERIRSLERQFKEKLSGESTTTAGSFLTNSHALAQAYQAQNLQGKVELLSLRFNDRLQETTLEVKAASLSELQALRQALENAGLKAEIASATNDKDGVKGRVRIGGAA